MLRARLLLGHVLVSCSDRFEVIPIGLGSPSWDALLSLLLTKGKHGLQQRKGEEREREKKFFRIAGSFFSFMWVPPTL